MMNEKCLEVRLLLPWYINDTLDQEERIKAAVHLAGCGDCRKELAGLSAVVESLQIVEASLDTEMVNEMLTSIMAAVDREENGASEVIQELMKEIVHNPISPAIVRSIFVGVGQRLLRDTEVVRKYQKQVFAAIQQVI